MHTWPSAARLRFLSRRGCLVARVLNLHMLRPWMDQLRAACGLSSHSSGPCGKVGFFFFPAETARLDEACLRNRG